MRTLIATLVIILGALVIPALPGAPFDTGTATTYAQAAQPQQPQTPTINVEINRGGRAWYLSPVWIAIGVIAAVLLIVLIAMAVRGGGSGGATIVKG
jgi:hypothetical protein